MDKGDLSAVKEIFANNAQEQAPVAEVAEVAESVEEVTETPLEAEAGEVESLENGETQDEEVSEVEGEADENDTYTVSKLAESIGWEAKDLYDTLVIPLDDNQEPIPLGEFKNVHQNLVRDHEALKVQVEQQTEQLQQANTGGQQQQQMSNEMMEAQGYLASVMRAEQNTNWAELEQLDPTEAVMKRDKFRRAKEDVGQKIQQIQQAQTQQQQQYMVQAGQEMLKMIPAWSDPTAKTADQSSIREYLRTKGYQDNEISNISDPRLMAVMKDLIDLNGQKTLANEAVKKVRKAPKVLKGKQFKKQTNQDMTKKLVTKAKSSRDKGDQMDAIKSILSSRNR